MNIRPYLVIFIWLFWASIVNNMTYEEHDEWQHAALLYFRFFWRLESTQEIWRIPLSVFHRSIIVIQNNQRLLILKCTFSGNTI